ncbi:MAG: PAS domain S-box protein [Geobacter sp.]|nr:MAG: PAS domain S-box protein [Geobacter sp.]
MNSPDLFQVLDIEEIQKLLEAYFKLTGIISAILDPDGNVIVAVGWQDICTHFHRSNPISRARCQESALSINSHLAECRGSFLEYKCKNGLWDVALPIFIEGEHVATFFTGQFFYEDDMPDRDYFRAQAEELGFNVEDYLSALDRVPVFSRSQIRTAMDYYRSLFSLISDTGRKKLRLKEHSRVKGSLRESEATLQTITDAARDAIIMIDNVGKITFWNPAAVSILGWQEAEAIGRDIHLLLAPDCYNAAYHKGMALFTNTGQGDAVGKTVELRALRKDGSKIPIELSLSCVQRGNHWHAVGIIRDISKRKSYEQKRKLSGFVFDNISDCIEWISPEGRFLDINEASCSSLGYSREEMLSLSVFDIDPSLPASSWPAMWKKLRNIKYMRIESIHKDRFGRVFPVDITSNFITLDDTELVCSIVRDISERKEAEEALQASEDRYRIFTAITSDYVFKCSRKGSAPFRILWMAGPVKAITGYSEEDIFALGCWRHIIHPDDATRIITQLMQLTPGQKVIHQFRIITKHGDTRWIRQSSFCQAGKELEELILHGCSQDITKQEMLQEQVLKNQKLESLGVLAGGIAHDFNNILTGIMGNISFARMFLDNSHKAYRPLEAAEKASGRAARLAQQLLTFAKGGAPIKKKTSLRPLVEECLSLVLRGTNVHGVLDIAESISTIEADEGQLGQVINNIIINAVQAMPGGGQITVQARNLTLSSENNQGLPAGRYVKLSFTDEGCGIKDEDRKKVFDPYYTTKPGGSGLGLASSHSIISRHNGCIEIESCTNKGTTVSFYLPSLESGDTNTVLTVQRQKNHDRIGENILVMDDEEMIRIMTQEMLEHLGYKVTTCSNGEQAITLYSSALQSGTSFYATILDLTIRGGMGGIETAQSILAQDPSARLIVSSGYSNDPFMEDYSKYGINSTLIKPYNADDLTRVLTT